MVSWWSLNATELELTQETIDDRPRDLDQGAED